MNLLSGVFSFLLEYVEDALRLVSQVAKNQTCGYPVGQTIFPLGLADMDSWQF